MVSIRTVPRMVPRGMATRDQCRQFPVRTEFVFSLSLLEVDLLSNSVVQIDLSIDHIFPCRCTGILSRVSIGTSKLQATTNLRNQPYMSRR